MFEKSYKDQNNEVTTIEICNPNQTDLRLQLSKIKESNPTALLLIVHPGEAVPALKQIKELGIKAQIFGGDTFSNKVIYSEALDVAQGVIFTLPATPNNEEYQKFSNEYKKRFNMDADINAAAAYDVLLLIAKAIKNGAYNGETIKEYFFNMKTEFIGATGLIKWDNNGDVVSKTYNSFIIKDNNYTIFK
jgi:branched-chain amino acid transport system substrate-binding protein